MNFLFKRRAYIALIVLLALFLPALTPITRVIGAETEVDSSSGIFLIKNEETDKYVSFSGNRYMLTDKNENDPSQYFRPIGANEKDTYILNSADNEAKSAISFFFDDGGKMILNRADKGEASSFFIDKCYGGVTIYTLIEKEEQSEPERCYLSVTDGEELCLSQERTVWVMEEVEVTSISMAYFETRVKLYSVQRFYATVSPAAISSFMKWETDDLDKLMVSSDGTICALSEGEAYLTASVGDYEYSCRIEIYDSEAFTWFSQENVINSYWNAGALSGIKFYRKPFASQGGLDWMREGCAIVCIAMLFHNLGATYTNGYDFRSGQNGNIPADPYTVALANVGYKGFTSSKGTYYSDPIYARWSAITEAFNVDGRALSVEHKFQGRAAIRDALKEHPEGVVVRLTKPSGDTHFVLFTECLNPNEKKASKLKFVIYDPMATTKSRGDGVPFEQSESYIDGYRYSHITDFYVWKIG